MRAELPFLLAVLAVAGCAAGSQAPPSSSVRPLAAGSSSSEPQPSNSLPQGSSVNAPLTPSAGDVGSTRVGPARSR